MKLTDQINALKHEHQYSKIHSVPRFISAIISLPLLTMLFNAFSIVGAYIISLQPSSRYWIISNQHPPIR